MKTNSNPHALATAQDDDESFEVMLPPPANFDMYQDRPKSAARCTKARKQVHLDQDWHRSVHVWIVDAQVQQLVLQKRSPHKDTFPNRWDISSAGHIEAGDDSRETAIRELLEEVGLQATTSDLIFAYTCPAQQAPLGGCNCYEDVYFLMRSKESCQFAAGEAEVTAIEWIDITALRAAWDEGDAQYVPRVAPYRKAFFQKLEELVKSES